MTTRDHQPSRVNGDPEYGIAPPGNSLPAGMTLGPVVLQVADLERSLAYYGQVLGLRSLDRSGAIATLGTHGGHGEHGARNEHGAADVLVELREKAGAAPVPPRGQHGLYHFALLLPDRAALGRFASHLAHAGVAPGASDHLVTEALYLNDPDGHGIEVYADRPRDQWRHRQRQLLMATDPLDVHDVIAAAGGEPWAVMPPGTRMGHVHLHVGDLREAERFYHEGLGLDKVVWGYPGALFMSAGGYHHHLGVNTWAARATAAAADDARMLEWQVVVPEPDDVAAVARNLEERGYAAARDGRDLLVRDPWGTALRVIPTAPRS
jgi:catechol 2,3-dioxygenase